MFRGHDEQSDLIAAKATPDATSAIAVVRLSGRGASNTVEEIMNLSAGSLHGRKRVVGTIAGAGKVVALSWKEGRSYTGEEMVEIMCHGIPGTTTEIMKLLEMKGARSAEPGEFTRRAWLNGKLTDTDILLLSARFRNIPAGKTEQLAEEITDLLTETEALIEFSEEHMAADPDQIENNLCRLKKSAEEMKVRIEEIEIMPRVYIMGPVNAGKSTLFNLLCGEKAAVVSEVPGTTRDGAARQIFIQGRNIDLRDTAGTGGTVLDGEALSISLQTVRPEDRVIWMDHAQKEPDRIYSNKVIKIFSKNDEGREPSKGWISFSSFTGNGIEKIKQFITEPEDYSPSWKIGIVLKKIEDALRSSQHQDMALAAEQLKDALSVMNQGEALSAAVERALDSFCVGK